MHTYRFVEGHSKWPFHMTTAQYEAACTVAHRFGLTHTVEVEPLFGAPDTAVINTGKLTFAVEPDGYIIQTHGGTPLDNMET